MNIQDIKIPFDQYDIFGYIMPASVFVIGFFLLYFFEPAPIITKIINFLKPYQIQKPPWFFYIIIPISILVSLYFLGHVIASFGSIFVDKIFIEHSYGHHHKALGNIDNFSNSHQYTLMALFSWLLGCTIFLFFIPQHLLLIMGSFAFLILANICLLIIFKKGVTKTNILHPHILIFHFIALNFSKLIHIHEPLSSDLSKQISEYFRNLFDMEITKARSDAYWLPYIYIRENYPDSGSVLKQFLNLCGFSRNLSVSLFLLTLIGFGIKVYFKDFNTTGISIFTVTTFILSLVFLIRYNYLYYTYHYYYLLRTFAVTQYLKSNHINESTDEKQSLIASPIVIYEMSRNGHNANSISSHLIINPFGSLKNK